MSAFRNKLRAPQKQTEANWSAVCKRAGSQGRPWGCRVAALLDAPFVSTARPASTYNRKLRKESENRDSPVGLRLLCDRRTSSLTHTKRGEVRAGSSLCAYQKNNCCKQIYSVLSAISPASRPHCVPVRNQLNCRATGESGASIRRLQNSVRALRRRCDRRERLSPSPGACVHAKPAAAAAALYMLISCEREHTGSIVSILNCILRFPSIKISGLVKSLSKKYFLVCNLTRSTRARCRVSWCSLVLLDHR